MYNFVTPGESVLVAKLYAVERCDEMLICLLDGIPLKVNPRANEWTLN